MKLSIITINYNNAEGLCRTIQSVQSQTFHDFEHIIVDGGSTDDSVDIIRQYADNEAIRLEGYKATRQKKNGKADDTLPNRPIASSPSRHEICWISEKDKGIYDAQNKGIRLAHGEYCYFLNAGDTFCADDVLERMFSPNSLIASSPNRLPDILYGNEIIVDGNGQRVGIARGVANPSFVDLYNSCMKHQASFIRRSLFDKYGMYDDTMRMDADWDWFLRVIGFNQITLEYRNVDIAYFETNGYSYTHPEVERQETEIILNRYMPSPLMQMDYELFSRYAYLKDAHKQPFLRFCLRVIMNLAKIQQKWQYK